MNLLNEQSKVINGLQKTIENLNETIKNLKKLGGGADLMDLKSIANNYFSNNAKIIKHALLTYQNCLVN